MHAANYEFLMKPKGLAECHQTLSSWEGWVWVCKTTYTIHGHWTVTVCDPYKHDIMHILTWRRLFTGSFYFHSRRLQKSYNRQDKHWKITINLPCINMNIFPTSVDSYSCGLMPNPLPPPSEKWSGEQSQISWDYSQKVVRTNEITRWIIIT